MTDLFNQPKNFPREKIQGQGVPWAHMIFAQAEREHMLEKIQDHICKMKDDEKASGYAKYLVTMCGFPHYFFNNCPNVILKFDN